MLTRIEYFTILFLFAMVLLLHSPRIAISGDIKLIVNKSVSATSFTKEEIKNIFLGTMAEYADRQIIKIVINKTPEVQTIFMRKYLRKTPSQFDCYHRNRLFAGKGAIPIYIKEEQRLLAYVAKTKGAISFVSLEGTVDNVKVIDIIE